MFKRDLIKKLHELGIRKGDKPGCGTVSLQHFKTEDLCRMLEAATRNE